ncbi:MAG: ATP-binding protein, partial [Myxococcota bacterium]
MALRGVTTPQRSASLSNQLAISYRLPAGIVFRSVQTAQAYALADHNAKTGAPATSDTPPTIEPDHLLKAIRQQLDHQLGSLADPVAVQMTLGQVVLTKDNRTAIEEVLAFARHSPYVFNQWRFGEKSPTGKGLSVLFSGPPGTGKTLVAGVIAHELGRFLYRIDLSQVVDKYIGETEKNLGRVFDEAERAQAILLFDEADSLFSKRTDVKSSKDRYANLEVNYLLQRLDDFTGVSILTTNHPQSIDDAFQRRIRFKVEFPMPDHDMRRNLWQRLLPPAAPVDDNIDWDLLAEDFEYSGGHIRNAILRASVRAAARGQGISEALLYDSAVDESRELGQLVRRY